MPQGQAHVPGTPHTPVSTLHTSWVQGLPSSGHVIVAPGKQAPAAQVSDSVHGLPSLHGAELGTPQRPVPGSQTSSVQPFPSSRHCFGV